MDQIIGPPFTNTSKLCLSSGHLATLSPTELSCVHHHNTAISGGLCATKAEFM